MNMLKADAIKQNKQSIRETIFWNEASYYFVFLKNQQGNELH